MQLADGEEYYNILCGSDTVGVLLNEVAESCKLEGKGTYKITCDGDSLGVITIKDAPKPVEESSSSVAEDEDDNDDEDDVTEESSSSSSKKNSSSSAKEDEDESSSSKDKSSSSAKSSDSKEEGSSSSEKSSEETSSSSVNGSSSSEATSSSSVAPASSSSEECKDTETQTCLNGELIDNSKVGSCGTVKYNKDVQACSFENKIISKENAALCVTSLHPTENARPYVIDLSTHACVDGEILSKANVGTCGSKQFNNTTHQCIDGVILSNENVGTCGSKQFNNTTHQCINSEIVSNENVGTCGTKPFNNTTHQCVDGVILSNANVGTCGTKPFNNTTHACVDGEILSKTNVGTCGSKQFNNTTHQCVDGEILSNANVGTCGSKKYNNTTHQCLGTSIVANEYVGTCGSKKYDTKVSFCNNNTMYTLCGGNEYEPTEDFCYKNAIHALCNGKTYTPKTGGTCNKSEGNYYFSENNQSYFVDLRGNSSTTYRYETIGSKFWMAEDLIYRYSGSLYNDSTHKILYSMTQANNACPEGWSLPSKSDYSDLFTALKIQPMTTLGTGTITADGAGKRLKSTLGWEINGTDELKLNFEPTGIIIVSNGKQNFNESENGFWWTSTEKSSTGLLKTAYNFELKGSSNDAEVNTKTSIDYLAVRCIKTVRVIIGPTIQK